MTQMAAFSSTAWRTSSPPWPWTTQMTFGESCFAVSKTCASSARPARRCSTLGMLECMRLPGPAARMTMFTKSGGNSAGCRLSRQLGKTHQRLVYRASALAAFADRPHDERLPAAHVARGKNLGNRSDVAAFSIGRRLGVTARVLLDAERLEHGRHRRNESHREKHEVGGQHRFRSRDFAHLAALPLKANRFQHFHLSVLADELFRGDRPIALYTLLVRGRGA